MGQIDILPAGDRLLGLGIQNGYGADHKSSLTIPEIHEAGCLYFGARDHVTGAKFRIATNMSRKASSWVCSRSLLTARPAVV